MKLTGEEQNVFEVLRAIWEISFLYEGYFYKLLKYVLFGYSNKEEYYKINDFERISKTEIDDFAEGMVMSMFQRKIYGRLLEWKQESEGKTALLVIGVDDNSEF